MKDLEFKFERKKLKRDEKLPALCRDYEPEEGRDYCVKADLCKNATYGFENRTLGTCFGGTRSSELDYRSADKSMVHGA